MEEQRKKSNNIQDYNNLGINIPIFLQQNYSDWLIKYPEIYQLDENFNILKEWSCKKEILIFYNSRPQGLDLALRKLCRFKGFFFCWKVLFEKENLRPILSEKRNEAVYAYNPSDELLKRYYNYESFSHKDFYESGLREQFQFITRFKNSVICGSTLDLSITNIRRCAKHEPTVIFHKDYFFSFTPLLKIHKLTADILELSEKNNKGIIKEEEKFNLIQDIIEFKIKYKDSENNREIGFKEKQLWDLLRDKTIPSL